MLHRLSIVVVALACTTTLAAQVVTQGTKTRGTTGISTQPGAPTAGQAILQRLPTLAPPTELNASGTTLAISLTWRAAAAATGYKVWRSPLGGVESLLTTSPTTATSLQDNGPFAAFNQYTYKVAAVYASGESGPAQVTFLPPPSGPLPAPTGVSTQWSETLYGWTTRWNAVADAASYQVTYRVTWEERISTIQREVVVVVAAPATTHFLRRHSNHPTDAGPTTLHAVAVAAVFPNGARSAAAP